MSKLKIDNRISGAESDLHYSKNIICCKWYDRKPVFLLATNADGMSGVSKVMRLTKGSATKAFVSCRNIIKPYNNGMGSVDIMDNETAAYRLDHKSKHRFYLRKFFDLLDVEIANSHIVYMKHGNDISLLNFKIVVAKSLIGRYSNGKRLFPTSRQNK